MFFILQYGSSNLTTLHTTPPSRFVCKAPEHKSPDSTDRMRCMDVNSVLFHCSLGIFLWSTLVQGQEKTKQPPLTLPYRLLIGGVMIAAGTIAVLVVASVMRRQYNRREVANNRRRSVSLDTGTDRASSKTFYI